MNLGLKNVYFFDRVRNPKFTSIPISLRASFINPACRASSLDINPNNSQISGFLPRLFISLYKTQPENSAVNELTKKSMSSFRNVGSKASKSISSQSFVFLKWVLFGSDFSSPINLSQSNLTDSTLTLSNSSKSVV